MEQNNIQDQTNMVVQNDEPKNFTQYNEIEYLGKLFSKHFHYNSWSPDFFINDIKKNGAYWDIRYTDEPVKKMSQFLLNSHLPQRLKKYVYYKAERANQDYSVSEILAHYFLKNINQIHYQQQQITHVGIQKLTVVGHKNPYDQEQEIYLLQNKLPITVIFLKTISGQTLYMDLCASQLDINSYSDDGMPYLLLTELSKNKLYAPKFSNAIKVISIDEPIITSDNSHYESYLKDLINNKNENLDDDELDYLQNYHEKLESDFSNTLERQAKINNTQL